MFRRRALVATLAALTALAAACASNAEVDATADGEIIVVTTVSPITSIAASVIGDRASIWGLVPEGTNSHTFEPRPSDAAALARADVVFANGLALETPTLELAADVATSAVVVPIGDRLLDPADYRFDFSFPEEAGDPNPHLWTDPTTAAGYATVIADTMAEVDPDHADDYRDAAADFVANVDAFTDTLRTSLATVPPANRKLLTYHDSFAYFADTFDWQIIGAIQPADFAEPTAREVVSIIEQIRSAELPAIFGSEVFPSSVLAQIANEVDAAYVDDLRDDDLPGQPGAPEHSYLGLLQFDFVTIVRALGGDPEALEAFVLPVTVDNATYPQ